MFFNAMRSLLLTAVICLLTSSCTKKPKIDLSGLRDNPAGGGVESLSSTALGQGPEFSSDGFTAAGGGNEPAFAGFGGTSGAASDGSWGDLDKPVAVSSDDAFLVNTQVWDEVVYFAFNRAEVSPSERYKLDALAEVLLANPEQGVIIEGHCDDRGSDEYNRALSERRALSAREYLLTLGIADNRMTTISYGEDKPVIPNARTESEHQLNRRAQFLLGTKK